MSDQDLTWILSPHGKSKNVAQWVLDRYKDGVPDNPMVEKWIKASQQILDTDELLGLCEKDDNHI